MSIRKLRNEIVNNLRIEFYGSLSELKVVDDEINKIKAMSDEKVIRIYIEALKGQIKPA